MCGIVGYIGPRQAPAVVMGGLKRLEYRGYDSAGIAVLDGDSIDIRRDVGKLGNLEALLAQELSLIHIYSRRAKAGQASRW